VNLTHKLVIEVVTILVKKNPLSQEIRPVVDAFQQMQADSQYLCIRKLKLIQELVVEGLVVLLFVTDVDHNFQ
jgi:hypothetical protein